MKRTYSRSSVTRTQTPRPRGLSAAARRTMTVVALGAAFLSTHGAYAASATWNAAPTDSNWVTNGTENNWSTGAGTYPGSTSSTTNGDTATFNNASSQMGITINQVLNILSMTFDTAAGSYTIGATGGNSLLLSSGGTTQIASTLAGTNITETINAPLVLEPTSSSGAGAYTFANNNGTASNVLNFGGTITGGTTSYTNGNDGNPDGGSIILTLNGSNTGLNTISGVISDGGAGTNTTQSGVAIRKTGTGTWYLTNNANTYTGEVEVSQGILNVSSVSDYGVASAIGARTSATDKAVNGGVGILINGGTLQYTGSTAQSTNRNLRLGSNTNTIDASGTGSGTLSFTHTGSNVNLFQSTASPNLTLTGTNTGANTFALNLTNGVSLVKNGAGTWVYSGTDSSSNGITENAGTLALSGSNSFSGAISVANGATLQLQANAGNTSGGVSTALNAASYTKLTLNSGSTTQLRSDSNVTFGGFNSLGGVGAATVNFDVNQLTGAGGNNTLSIAPSGFATYQTTLNVTGGSGDTLGIGSITNANGSYLSLNANTANLTVGGINNVSGLTVGGASNTAIIGVISGSNLTKNGAGTLTLTGANTYGGGTTINAGTLAGTTTGLQGNITDNSALIFDQTLPATPIAAGTYAGVISGGGTVAKNNAGIVTLSGTNTYNGTTTINGGTLNVTGALGNTAVTVNSGATLSGTGNGTSTGLIGGTLNATGGSAITLATTGTQLTTTGAVTLGTAGTYSAADYSNLMYTLGGSNTTEALNTAAGLTANNAYIDITNPSQTGTYTLANYASLNGGSDFSLSSTAGNVLTQNVGRDSETLNVGTNLLTLTIAGAGTPNVAYFDGAVSKVWNDLSNTSFVNFSTNLAGTADAGNVVGATSDVILNAANAPANQGNPLTETLGASTIINSLNVNGNGTTTLGADGSTLTINALGDSNTASDGSYTGNTAGTGINVMSGANPFTVNVPLILGNSQTYFNNSASTFTVNGTVTGQSLVNNTLTLADTSSGATTLTGAIADGSGGTLALLVNNTGSGVTTLSGASTYTGGTTVASGTLMQGAANAIGAMSNDALAVNGGTFDLGGFNLSTTGLSGTGGNIINSSATAATLTSTGTGSTTLASVLGGAGGNNFGLTENGPGGTLTLSGANTYTGATTVSGGTLKLGSASALPTNALAGGSSLVINTGGTLALNNNNLTLSGLPTGTGGTISNGSATAGTSTLTFTGGTGTLAQTLTNGGTGKLALSVTGGNVTTNATNSYTGGTVVTGGTLQTQDDVNAFGTNGSGTTVAITSPGTVIINSAASNTYSDTFSGNGLLKFNFNGGGSDTVANNFNNFTGTIEVGSANGGSNKLQIQSSVPTNLASSTLQIDNGGQYFTGGDVNFGTINVIGTGNGEGRGAIRLNGNGTSSGVIGGNVFLQGNTTIGNEGGVLTGNISTGVAGTSTLTMGTGNSNGTAGLSGNISNGAGTLALKTANGTTTLSGANTYTGGTTVNNGSTLNLNGAHADGSGVLVVGNGGSNGTEFSGGTVDLNTNTATQGSATGADSVTLFNGGTIFNGAGTTTAPNSAVPVTGTASGGTAPDANASGGTPPTNNTQTFGTLTLSGGTTYIDFGAGNTGGVFKFADSSAAFWTGTLDVYDWNGNDPTGPFTPNGNGTYTGTTGGGGLDELFFGSSTGGLTVAQLGDIHFFSGQGTGALGGPTILADGEVVAAPEPSQVGMMGLMAFGLGGLILRARKRQAKENKTA